MDSLIDEKTIADMPLFCSLPASEFEFLTTALRKRTVPPGTVLIQEGDKGDRFYVILKGWVEIIKAMGTASESLLDLTREGEFIGEMSLFNRDGLRTASARTRTQVDLVEMRHDDFDALLQRRPALALEIMRELSLRLHETNDARIKILERTNQELNQAYEETLEGWAKALELRDQETEGHTRRVTEMTIELAKILNIDEEELINIRRGALLHDIGKMGIPDGILLKPGPLSEEERTIMCRHTVYALQMLSQIDFLMPAIAIPYCHHERWDGTGYPQGLQGEEIPFGARIFSVVDVWDALSSDRPYRKAWPHKKVIQHIQSLSGTHFEPKVVDALTELYEQRYNK